MYLAPQNIPHAISVLILGNKVLLYKVTLYCVLMPRPISYLSAAAVVIAGVV